MFVCLDNLLQSLLLLSLLQSLLLLVILSTVHNYYTENTALLQEKISYSTPDCWAIVSTVIPLSSLQSSILAYWATFIKTLLILSSSPAKFRIIIIFWNPPIKWVIIRGLLQERQSSTPLDLGSCVDSNSSLQRIYTLYLWEHYSSSPSSTHLWIGEAAQWQPPPTGLDVDSTSPMLSFLKHSLHQEPVEQEMCIGLWS